jgi:hypothetical protein
LCYILDLVKNFLISLIPATVKTADHAVWAIRLYSRDRNMEQIFLIIFSGTSIIFLSTFGVSWGQIFSPIKIDGNIDPKSISLGKNVLVTVSLTNTGDLPAKGLDVQVISSGFKIVSEKKWPANIYPGSSVLGQYTLQPYTTGTFPILVSATYVLNNTAVTPPEINQTVSNQKLGDVYVHSDFDLSWSAAWAGAPTTILGALIGFGIAQLTDHWTSKRAEQKDKNEKKNLAKSYILNWLEVNQKAVGNSQPPRFGKTWDGIESVYQFIPIPLRTSIRDLYIELLSYATSGTKSTLSPGLCTTIGNILVNARGWQT